MNNLQNNAIKLWKNKITNPQKETLFDMKLIENIGRQLNKIGIFIIKKTF